MTSEIFSIAVEYSAKSSPVILVVFMIVAITILVTKFVLRTNGTNEALPKIQALLAKMDKGLAMLNAVLLEKNIINQSCYSKEDSPRAVNKLGERLLEVSGAGALFERMKPDLLAALGEKKTISLLELERESLNVLLERMDDPAFIGIQNFAFQHPTFEGKPLTYTDILFMIALRLRDAYMAGMPGGAT